MNARTNRPGGGRLARPLVIAFALAAAAFPGRGEAQTEGNALYRVLLLRAAPGAFEAGMEALRESFTLIEEAGDTAPFWLRHSQGDQWDFMLIVPLGDFAEYYAAGGVVFGAGPGPRETPGGRVRLSGGVARTLDSPRGDGPALRGDRALSRRDVRGTSRPARRARGAAAHGEPLLRAPRPSAERDLREGGRFELQAFAAAGARFSTGEQDDAARAAGFDGVDDISPYLRSLLAYHHDTLAVPGR